MLFDQLNGQFVCLFDKYNLAGYLPQMSPPQSQEQQHTLTNPRLSTKPQQTNPELDQFQVKLEQMPQSPIRSNIQNPFINQNNISLPVKLQAQKTSIQQSPDFLKQFSIAQNHRIVQLKHQNEQKNIHLNLNQTFNTVNQPKAITSEMRYLEEIQQDRMKPQRKQDHQVLFAQNDQTHLSGYDLDEDFALMGTDLQKTEIILTIQEKLLKPFDSHQNLSSDPEAQIILNHPEKMEIQEPSIMERHLKRQVQPIQSLAPKINFKQIKLSLTDAKEKRQLRRLTPIKSLKKYILQKFGYSHGAQNCQNLQLFFYNLYPNQSPLITLPITSEENLQLILSEYLKARKDIFIMFQNDGTLKKKVERKTKENQAYQIQFDSDGQLEDEQLSSSENSNQNGQNQQINQIKLIKKMIMVNKTQKSRYRGTNLVRCAFCQKANKDIQSIKICGPFYGPFIQGRKKTKHYSHLLCALWCKKVFLDENNDLQKIPMQITRAQKKFCEYCNKDGAGLLCKRCNASMHYECGLGKCQFLWATYELYCLDCKDQMNKELQGNEPMQIEPNMNVEDSNINEVKPDMQASFGVKLQGKKQEMQIHPVLNINFGESFGQQSSQSRTQSIPNQKNSEKSQQNQLMIDPSSKLQINGEQESESVEILESMCKSSRSKRPISNIKIEETESLLKSNQKPRRGRPPRQAANK